ncbi:hypothetical protein Aab01nite_74760 [Paractinoplanes abujensis]|uniref:UDP-glucose 6-dehydrogenase n=1 Tax=Paractinoplanes abujensis TaxID=882441 RepID=A0A7W7G3S2_9ACTN|nr:UDP-glucose 6-dehydrogenase [Actinoplanes abujensis]GID23886.1 hypothetical protein Aab01nite_74760 [Actinoplanes abujensis]
MTDVSLVIVVTEWADFRNAGPVRLGELVADRQVIDWRNCLDREQWHRAGQTYPGMGRPPM